MAAPRARGAVRVRLRPLTQLDLAEAGFTSAGARGLRAAPLEGEPGLYSAPNVVFGCEHPSLAKRHRAPPEELCRIRMSIGNHVPQEVCAA